MAIDITPTTILAPFEAEHQAVNLTRNNKGTRWDRIGNNKLIDPDQWRYNYNPDTGIFEGRTIMGQWTNEILDPRDMTTGNWEARSNITITRNQVGINGEPNNANLLEDTTDDFANVIQEGLFVPDDSNPHCAIAYFDKDNDESRFPELNLTIRGGNDVVQLDIQLNTKTGAVATRTNDNNGDFWVNDKGDQWEVVGIIYNNGTGNTEVEQLIYPAISDSLGGATSSVTGSCVVSYTGLFLNRSSPPPTPVYGETAGQSYTQDPDMPDVSNLADINYNPDESTFSIEFSTAYSEGTLFDLHSDANNRIYAHRNASNEIHLVIVDGGTTQADLNLGTIADNTQGKIAVGWKKDDIAGALNGGTVQTDASATIPTVDTLHIGRDYNDANYWDAFIASKLNYPRKLTNNQIQDEST